MINYYRRGCVNVSCDNCEWDGGQGFFTTKEAIQWLREHWTVRKTEDGEWEHYCPECAEALGYKAPTPGIVPKARNHFQMNAVMRKSDGSIHKISGGTTYTGTKF